MQRSRNDGAASDDKLIRRFVAAFELLDQCIGKPGELRSTEPLDGLNLSVDRPSWRPESAVTGRVRLEPLYRRLPSRFPDLYEQLVLAYRWPEVDLQIVRLLANPPGPTLSGLEDEIFCDRVLIRTLIPAGFVPFGKAPDGNYDPVCFDLNSMKRGDCPVIQFEHEAILCYDKIGQSWLRSSSFRELIYDTIELAQLKYE
jgi:hypothetical protein